jgi:hypothetical protein
MEVPGVYTDRVECAALIARKVLNMSMGKIAEGDRVGYSTYLRRGRR